MVQQVAIYKQGCKMIVSVQFRVKAIAITFRQNAGRNIFHLRQPMPDASL